MGEAGGAGTGASGAPHPGRGGQCQGRRRRGAGRGQRVGGVGARPSIRLSVYLSLCGDIGRWGSRCGVRDPGGGGVGQVWGGRRGAGGALWGGGGSARSARQRWVCASRCAPRCPPDGAAASAFPALSLPPSRRKSSLFPLSFPLFFFFNPPPPPPLLFPRGELKPFYPLHPPPPRLPALPPRSGAAACKCHVAFCLFPFAAPAQTPPPARRGRGRGRSALSPLCGGGRPAPSPPLRFVPLGSGGGGEVGTLLRSTPSR